MEGSNKNNYLFGGVSSCDEAECHKGGSSEHTGGTAGRRTARNSGGLLRRLLRVLVCLDLGKRLDQCIRGMGLVDGLGTTQRAAHVEPAHRPGRAGAVEQDRLVKICCFGTE